jgi:NAD(P)H-dependent flavin oxidoreductase YrpB (nitropropane dioxygenase family)
VSVAETEESQQLAAEPLTCANALDPNRIIKLVKQHGAYVIHKCTQVRHAVSSQKMGVDCLSIDG